MDKQQQWLPPAPDAPTYTGPTPAQAPPAVAPPPPQPGYGPATAYPTPAPGAYVAPAPVAAPVWGTYCRGCGNAMNPQAAMCMHCGVANVLHPPLQPSMPKSKTTAVVLVVLFGLFGWLYTYKADAWKFWLNLGITVVTLGIWGLVAWIWAIIDMAVRDSAWYVRFPNG